MFERRDSKHAGHSRPSRSLSRLRGSCQRKLTEARAPGADAPSVSPPRGDPASPRAGKRGRVPGFRFAGAGALALLLASALPAFAQSARAHWNSPGEAFKIIDNTYYVGTGGIAVYLITTPQGHFLIDGAVAESVPQIERHIKELGFNLSDVKYLLNSHAHLDHSGGLAQLKKDTGAILVASEGDKSALESGSYLGSESNHALDSVPVKVDRTIGDGQTLTLGGVTLTANLTPGHTRGCTSWGWTAKEGAKSYAVLDFCSVSVAANRLVGPPQYPGIVSDYEKTFAKAKTMHVDVFLAPHPEFFRMAQKRAAQKAGASANPFIDPNAFQPFIARAEADFRKQLAAQEAALKKRKP
jgi:metallo-beta-lactamase class B